MSEPLSVRVRALEEHTNETNENLEKKVTEHREMNDKIRDKEEEIEKVKANSNADADAKNAEIAKLTQALSDLRGDVVDLNQEFAEKLTFEKDLKPKTGGAESEIEDLKISNAKKEAVISHLEEASRLHADHIKAMREAVEQLNKEIADLREQSEASRQTVASLEEEKAKKSPAKKK